MAKIETPNAATIYLTNEFKKQMKLVMQYACTLVEAPMGYGKTTGVREYLKTLKVRILWQKLHDGTLSGFWKDFCRLFKEVDMDCYESLMQIGFPTNSNGREAVLELIQKVLETEPTILVIDDFHLAEQPEINDFIEYLLWNELPELHIVLTARYTRLSNLDELILKGYLQHIQKDALEFSQEEIEVYYRLCGIMLQDNEKEYLHTYTEGWVSALYLLMLNYKEEGRVTSLPNISRLIEKTVFLPFSQEIREFLVYISYLENFTLEQAAHMWQKENTEVLLQEIVSRNAFVNLDEKTGIYQIHRIFSDFLQELVKKLDPKGKDELYHRTAKWYAQTGDYISALRYYYLTKDFEAILEILEKDQGHGMVNEHCEELISYYEECPDSIKENHPVALLVIAICFFSYNEIERFATVCEEIGMLLQKNADSEDPILQQIAGELELLLVFSQYNDIEKMGEHIKAACSLLDHPAKFMDTRGGWTFGSPSVLYMFHREPGQLDLELTMMKDSLPYYSQVANGHGAGADQIMEAEISYIRGDFDNAEILAHKALYYANLNQQHDILICAVFIQIKLALYKGDYSKAMDNLQKIKEETEKGKWYHLFDTIELCQVFLQVALRQTKEIPEWILTGDYGSSKLLFPSLAYFNIIYGQVLLVQEEYHKLLGNMDYFMENASIFPNLLAQLYAHIYAAAANEKLSRRAMALEEINTALALAVPDQLRMPFVENCEWIKPLLADLYREDIHREFITTVLELYEPYERALHGIVMEHFTEDKPVLTEREMEVAQLVAKGLSNKEIGLQLYISPNTVKTILKHIFEKLEISSRSMLKHYIEE